MDAHPLPFNAAAAEFCDLIESADRIAREQLLVSLADVLPRLYAAAANLPDIAPEGDAISDEGRMTHDEWSALFSTLYSVLGESDLYWTTPALDEEEREVFAGSLSDDLADIYRDLKEGLVLLYSPTSEREVVWEWRFSFWTHWGSHAVEALRAVHAQLATSGGPMREPD